jgi:hypothetical protein
MKTKTITIEIDELGSASIDLENFHGQGCAAVVKDFRGGDTVITSRTKREYTTDLRVQLQKVKN